MFKNQGRRRKKDGRSYEVCLLFRKLFYSVARIAYLFPSNSMPIVGENITWH